MARRNFWLIEALYVVAFRMPGWGSFLVASAVYAVLNFGPAYIDARHGFLDFLEHAGPRLAPWAAGLILLMGTAAQIYKRSRHGQHPPSRLEKIRALSWEDFEKRVSDAYRRQGYRVEKYSSDPRKEPSLVLRRPGEIVLIQCQQWKAKEVGVSAVRAFFRVMVREQATLGILVTCGRFSPEAQAFAEGKPLVLVEGNALLERIGQVQQQGRKKVVSPAAKKRSLSR